MRIIFNFKTVKKFYPVQQNIFWCRHIFPIHYSIKMYITDYIGKALGRDKIENKKKN